MDEDEEEDGDVAMPDDDHPAKFTPSKRKKKQPQDEAAASEAGTDSTAPSSSSSEIDYEESEADTVGTSVDDGLPHPRVSFHHIPFSLSLLSTLPLFPVPPSPFPPLITRHQSYHKPLHSPHPQPTNTD